MKPYYEDTKAGITIFHGDCREILPHLPKVDLVLTDPPYNVNLGSQQHGTRIDNVLWYKDAMPETEYLELICFIHANIGERAIITPGNGNQFKWPNPKWTMAWVKTNPQTRSVLTRGQKICFSAWEPILVYGKLDSPPLHDTLTYPIGNQPDAGSHPCPKPYKLWLKLMSFCNSETVLDPFMGSGTTLRAAKDLGRKAIGIEIEEKYCEIAAKRLSQEVLNFDNPKPIENFTQLEGSM